MHNSSISYLCGAWLLSACFHTPVPSDEYFLRKTSGAGATVATLPSTALLDEPNYEVFVARWMAHWQPEEPDAGVFAAYGTTIQPPPTVGYGSVGGRETDEAGYWMRQWCRRHGDSPAALSWDDMDEGQILEAAGVPRMERKLAGKTVLYCRSGRVCSPRWWYNRAATRPRSPCA